jgi:hypothetical protein
MDTTQFETHTKPHICSRFNINLHLLLLHESKLLDSLCWPMLLNCQGPCRHHQSPHGLHRYQATPTRHQDLLNQ